MVGPSWYNNSGWLVGPPCNGHDTNWYGVECMAGIVVGLNFGVVGNGLVGTVPTQLGLLTAMTSGLSFNLNSISGVIPTQLGRLTAMTSHLALDTNALSGFIPTQLGHLSAMTSALFLDVNSISGFIPTQLGHLTAMRQYLALGRNALSGFIPTELGYLTAMRSALALDTNSISGFMPTQLGRLAEIRSLTLGPNRLNYPHTSLASVAYDVATRHCGTTTACEGLPPLSCTAFAGNWRPIVGAPNECVDCAHGAAGASGAVALLAALLLLLLTTLVGLAWLVARRPGHLARWGSSCVILVTHVQALGICGGLRLTWPPAVRKLLAAFSLNALHIPSISCVFPVGGNDEDSAGVPNTSAYSWLYGYVFCACALAPLIVLLALAIVARHLQNDGGLDMLEMALSVAFALPLVTTWHPVATLLGQVAQARADAASTRAQASGRHFQLHDAFLSAADTLERKASIGIALAGSLLLVQALLAAHFWRRLRTLQALLRGPVPAIGWPLPPARLSRRLRYLAGRFAPHAAQWEYIVWAWQLSLFLVSEAMGAAMHALAADPAAAALAQYSGLAAALLLAIAAWVGQRSVQPYRRRVQNALASWLSALVVLVLGLATGYSLLVQHLGVAIRPLALAIEWLLLTLIVGGTVAAAVYIVADAHATSKAFATVDASVALVSAADERLIVGELRERLIDGTIKLVKCTWLLSPEADAVFARDTSHAAGAPIMRRRQELPEAAFVSGEHAAAILDRGDRSVLVVSHAWQTAAHPDPHGRTLATVRTYLRNAGDVSHCGLFVDFFGLPQKDANGHRTPDERRMFSRGLLCMGACYASSIGTAVLAQTVVPPPPRPYEGFNDRPYDARGWCRFERGVALIVGANLAAAARLRPLLAPFARAEASRPKVIDIGACASGGAAVVPELAASEPARILEETVAAVHNANFTGKGDKACVVAMLERFAWIMQTSVERAMQVADGGQLSVEPRFVRKWAACQRARAGGAGCGAGSGGNGIDDDGVQPFPLRPSPSVPATSMRTPPRQGVEISNFFAPPGVQIPEEDRAMVISAVKRHETSTHQKAHGALRRLAPVVKALSPRSQNRKFLAVIDRLEDVVGSTAEQGALVEQHNALRRDRETCKRLRKTSEARMERVNQAITHRRAHGTAGGSAIVTVLPAMGADI